jgi:hypothetical protein
MTDKAVTDETAKKKTVKKKAATKKTATKEAPPTATMTTGDTEVAVRIKKIRKSYTINQKLATLDYVKKHGLRPSSRQLGIGLSTIKRWRNGSELLNRLANQNGINPSVRSNKIYTGSCALIKKGIEDELIQHIENEIKNNQRKVSMDLALRKVRQLDPKLILVNCKILRRRVLRILHRRNMIVPTKKKRGKAKAISCKQQQEDFMDDEEEDEDVVDDSDHISDENNKAQDNDDNISNSKNDAISKDPIGEEAGEEQYH